MWPYWILFLLPAFQAISKIKTNKFQASSELLSWRLLGLLIFLMIGLRFEVGGDWFIYLENLDDLNVSFIEILEYGKGDLLFNFLSWLGIQSGLGIFLPNLVAAAAFTFGLMIFCKSCPLPWLALLLAVPYLITVVAMGYTRQGAAIGMMLLALVSLEKKNIFKFLLWATMASIFHKTAVIIIPLALFSGVKKPFLSALVLLGTCYLLFILLLQEHIDILIQGYIESKYQSSGAAIRVAMNAFPAIIFLLIKKRFHLNPDQQVFWTWMSWGAIGFILLLIISPSSTAVDRVALYWIPLQMYVGSRIPVAMKSNKSTKVFWIYIVVSYCTTVHVVWLFFADTAFAWLPYKFFLWEWLWN